MLIIKRINCTNTASGICHSYVGDCLVCFHTCIPDGHILSVTYARGCIDTIDSPDDEHTVA